MVMATVMVMAMAMVTAMVTAMVWKKKNNRGTNECLDSGRNKTKPTRRKKANSMRVGFFCFKFQVLSIEIWGDVSTVQAGRANF